MPSEPAILAPPPPPPTLAPWAAAVSGGSDSVAMLLLCRPWVGHVVHLDHETRGDASAGDACFVAELAVKLGLPVTVRRRSELEPHVPPTANRSAHFRRLRLALYREVITAHRLAGVLQAHHADDQAETVALRLLRGSSFTGLVGIAPTTTVAGIRIHRPLLNLRKAELIAFLQSTPQTWREDASNTSPAYARNRIRAALAQYPHLVPPLLHLATAARAYRDALTNNLPDITDEMAICALLNLPLPLRQHLARLFLGHKLPEVEPHTVDRFLTWLADASAGSKLSLPRALHARRQRGRVWLE